MLKNINGVPQVGGSNVGGPTVGGAKVGGQGCSQVGGPSVKPLYEILHRPIVPQPGLAHDQPPRGDPT